MAEERRAGCMVMACRHCGGELFRLVAPPVPGMKLGDRIEGTIAFNMAECDRCGEQYKTALLPS